MSQSVSQRNKVQPELIDVRRNPYLLDYEEQRRLRTITGRRSSEGIAGSRPRNTRPTKPAGQQCHILQPRDRFTAERVLPERDRRRSGAARRRRIVRRQRMAVGLWCACMAMLLLVMAAGKMAVSASGGESRPASGSDVQIPQADQADPVQTEMIQGLPAAVYAAHPDWTENFLTPNEYSRPGDPLERVDNIFVHYTANPGTSAAQNRSYFEQQKDVHDRSVSAHFIIGYDGEIIQCVPLDEIAYAVQTRNGDSISIECCYLAEDGSFTQETYDSLIILLSWLTEAYDLEVDDILRHYDCGGKKCPLYYTENPAAWEQLKEDVKAAKS